MKFYIKDVKLTGSSLTVGYLKIFAFLATSCFAILYLWKVEVLSQIISVALLLLITIYALWENRKLFNNYYEQK